MVSSYNHLLFFLFFFFSLFGFDRDAVLILSKTKSRTPCTWMIDSTNPILDISSSSPLTVNVRVKEDYERGYVRTFARFFFFLCVCVCVCVCVLLIYANGSIAHFSRHSALLIFIASRWYYRWTRRAESYVSISCFYWHRRY